MAEMDMEEMMGMMMMMMGSMMKLDVAVETGVINLMTESATIYIQVSQGGVPTDAETLAVTLIYDDPCNWTCQPPMFFGHWELGCYGCEPDPMHDVCDFIWADKNEDGVVDECETMHIPGLYVVTVCYGGFPPGDYLIWAYAEAPMDEMMGMMDMMGGFNGTEGENGGFNGTDMMDMMDMEEMMTARGVGIGGFTVSEDLTFMALGLPELTNAFSSMGTQIGRMMGQMESAMADMMTEMTENFAGNFEGLLAYQEGMSGTIGSMTGKMESMLGFLDDMIAFQEEMGQSTEDMLVYQQEMTERFENFTQGLDEFNAAMDATKILIEDLQGEISIIKSDVGETINALPVLHQEAAEVQALTAAGLPITQSLSLFAIVLSAISVVLLVKINRNTNGAKEHS
jgi:hypothetical protein